MLYGNRNGHADHRERHACDYRADGKTGGMRYAKKFRIPSEKTMANACDAGENLIGHALPLLSAHGLRFPAALRRYGLIRSSHISHFNSA